MSSLVKQGQKMATETIIKVLDDSTAKKQEKARKKAAKSGKRSRNLHEDDLGTELVKMAASTVGFVSEARKYRREKKMAMAVGPGTEEQPYQDVPDQTHQSGATSEPCSAASGPMAERIEENERSVNEPQEVVRLDDEQHATEQTPETRRKEASDLATAFLARHPHHQKEGQRAQLATPVVVPQRRPEKRARGFVRCYAPVLAATGIDEATFLDFLDTLNRVLTPNPYLHALNLAGLAGEAAPDPFSMLIGVGVDVATRAVLEVQSRRASSRFLDRANAGFFVPRGLVCLVATWAPDASDDDDDDDALAAAVRAEGARRSPPPLEPQHPDKHRIEEWRALLTQKSARDALLRRVQHQMEDRVRPARGGFRWPAAAPLVCPSAEATRAVLVAKADGGRKNAFDRGEVWVDDFLDRRAQARRMHRDQTLDVAAAALPEPTFRSRYADPNHPAASGDLVALVTGGRWSVEVTRAGNPSVRDADRPKANLEHEAIGRDQRSGNANSGRGRSTTRQKEREDGKSSAPSPFKTLFQKDVLYLLVLGLPEGMPFLANVDDTPGPCATG